MPTVDLCSYSPITIVKITLDYDASGVPHNLLENPCAFECDPKCFWFSDCKAPSQIALEAAPDAIMPMLASVTSYGQRLEIGKGISRRGTARVCINDWRIDCLDENSDFFLQTLRDDQKFWENRKIEIYYGDCRQTLDEMSKETYVIADAVSQNCQLCITAKDPLFLLDTENQSVPAYCPFDFKIRDDLPAEFEIDEDTGEFTKDPWKYINHYILSENYITQNPQELDCILCTTHLCVDGEALRVAPLWNDPSLPSDEVALGAFGPAGWNFVLLDRAQCGTSLSDIAAGTQAQRAETIEKCHVADVVQRLLNSAELSDTSLTCCTGDIDISIGCDSLEELRCKHPLNIIDEAIICDEEASDLLDELAQQNLFSVFFNNETQSVDVALFCPQDDAEISVLQECDIADGSISVTPGTERYSRVIVRQTKNCTESPSDSNTEKVADAVDAASEIFPICDRRRYRTAKTLTINSRWFGGCSQWRATTLANQLLCLYQTPRDRLTLSTQPNAACDYVLGQQVEIMSPKVSKGAWTLVAKTRSGHRNSCWRLEFENLFQTTQPVALGFACDPTLPAANLSSGDACDATCLIHL